MDYEDKESIGVEEVRGMVRGRRKGRPPDPDTVREWCRVGYGKTRLVLRHVKVAGELRFMREWVEDFVKERARLGTPPPPPPRGPTERQRAASYRRACDHLDKVGVK